MLLSYLHPVNRPAPPYRFAIKPGDNPTGRHLRKPAGNAGPLVRRFLIGLRAGFGVPTSCLTKLPAAHEFKLNSKAVCVAFIQLSLNSCWVAILLFRISKKQTGIGFEEPRLLPDLFPALRAGLARCR